MRRPMPLLVMTIPFVMSLAVSVAAAPAPAPVRPVTDGAALGRAVDAWAKPLLAAGHLSGQLLVARNGKVMFERSYGWANLELKVPMTPETRLCVASITKPMTVLIAFRLIEARKIVYRDSIARWLPDFPAADSITIGQLMNHRSGIPHEILPDSEMTQPRTAEEMVARARLRPLDFRPGTQSSYSTGGFTVLARILELASGKSYRELIQQYVFDPAGMTHSANPTSIELLPLRATGYLPGAHGIENAPFQDFSNLVGGGSVWSTARDIHAFVQAILDGKLGETERASWLRHGKIDFGGLVPGFRSFADYDSVTGLEVTFVGNVATGAPDLLRDAVKRLAAGEKMTPAVIPPMTAAAVSAVELKRLEGLYKLENGTKLDLRVRGGSLYANDWLLIPTADGAFFSPRDYGTVRGVAGPDGKISRLDWTQRGQVYPAPRIGD